MSISIQLQLALKERLAASIESHGGHLPIDEAVIDVLPRGTKSASAHSYGVSAWSFTAKINALDAKDRPVEFFMKYVAGELGVTFFILVEFKDSAPGLPNPVKLGSRLAAMHRNTRCPGGKFGFHLQTYDGARIQDVTPQDRWTPFFSGLLAEAYRQDVEANGLWPELDMVYKRVQSHLIPRLIGALEEEGKEVTPVLIHGDLWEGNILNDAETGDPWIFDCASYYAHNEMELGIWRAERHQLRAKVYRQEYLRHYEASEPKDEWEDRILLYSAKTNFMFSVCFPGRTSSRKVAFNDMLYLIQKYVPWEEGSGVVQPQMSQL
ncbi:hypothetical protein PG989_015003 [Apiospora arundinis]